MSVIVPVSPNTFILEGYGDAALESLMIIGVRFSKINGGGSGAGLGVCVGVTTGVAVAVGVAVGVGVRVGVAVGVGVSVAVGVADGVGIGVLAPVEIISEYPPDITPVSDA